MTDNVKIKLAQLSKIKGFEGVLKDEEKLKVLWECETPQDEPTLAEICKKMTPFKKMLLMVSLRPDKLVPSIRHFVIDTLGESFVQQEQLDVGKAFQETR